MATSTWSFQQLSVNDKHLLKDSNKQQQSWNQLHFYEKVQSLNLSPKTKESISNDTNALSFFIDNVQSGVIYYPAGLYAPKTLTEPIPISFVGYCEYWLDNLYDITRFIAKNGINMDKPSNIIHAQKEFRGRLDHFIYTDTFTHFSQVGPAALVIGEEEENNNMNDKNNNSNTMNIKSKTGSIDISFSSTVGLPTPKAYNLVNASTLAINDNSSNYQSRSDDGVPLPSSRSNNNNNSSGSNDGVPLPSSQFINNNNKNSNFRSILVPK
jgi:hypothetical protein